MRDDDGQPASTAARQTALRIQVRGVVQGVGFRPFVFQLAARCGVVGWVRNDGGGVVVHAQGDDETLRRFMHDLRSAPPPAARIASIEAAPAVAEAHRGFAILASDGGTAPTVRISPDLATCDACLRELRAAGDPRCGYPYINCTNCGPRYSIIERLPYDRANTTMRGWPPCALCAAQYADPADRRFHAQPVACPACGPAYVLRDAAGPVHAGPAAIVEAARLLRCGRIVAIKGLGGYHVACDARDREAVAALRERKFRKEKPFAVMVRGIEDAAAWVHITAAHTAALLDAARPIVLCHARAPLGGVAPGNAKLGVMLPYAPLHHLLFDAGAPSPLVLTSGNRSSEPIAYRDDDALARLGGIADAVLIGERPIARRVDDSVVDIHGGRRVLVRRSRGFAPGCVAELPAREPILAVGADLKNAITLVIDGVALTSQHIGDLTDADALDAWRETIRDLLAVYELSLRDVIVAHDMHPQYASTRAALALPAARHVAAQHHEAHIAAVAAEYGLLSANLVGVAFDGTGYGRDGTIWGGEYFVGSIAGGLRRAAWLRPVQMPGGDAAARFPAQALAAYHAALRGGAAAAGSSAGRDALAGRVERIDLTAAPFSLPPRFELAGRMVAAGVRCHPTSSAGRMFDAVAALLGFARECTFEGQAAIWLEALAWTAAATGAYPFDGCDPLPLIARVILDRCDGRPPAEVARAFHRGVAAGVAERAARLARETGATYVALSGGVFQNELLSVELCERLEAEAGLTVLFPRETPPSDGGISLGQAAIAAAKPIPRG